LIELILNFQDLLPTDLDPVSPESKEDEDEKDAEDGSDSRRSGEKPEKDLDDSLDSHLSGISELTSHGSEHGLTLSSIQNCSSTFINSGVHPMDEDNLSKVSSGSR